MRHAVSTLVLTLSALAAGCHRDGLLVEEVVPASPQVADPREENVALYDAMVGDLGSLAAADRQARVDRFWRDLAAAGGAPARGAGRLVFAVRDTNDGWTVAGTFNGWSPASAPLARIDGTDTLVAEVEVAAGSRHEYKLVREGGWSRDPAGRWVAWDGFDTGTVGAFNAVAYAGRSATLEESELYLLPPIAGSALGDARDVFVQVPGSYFPERAALPLLLVHDGNESLTRGRFDRAIDEARRVGDVPPLLIAYVALADPDDRMAEYTFGTPGARGDLYRAFLADELVPALETAFATPRRPEARGVIGASLGGLISYRIGFDRPDLFARVGGQSSSFFWNDNQLIEEFAAASPRGGRWYLDAGSDQDNGEVTAAMRDVLQAKGYEHAYVRDLEAEHDWHAWAGRFPGAVDYLFR